MCSHWPCYSFFFVMVWLISSGRIKCFGLCQTSICKSIKQTPFGLEIFVTQSDCSLIIGNSSFSYPDALTWTQSEIFLSQSKEIKIHWQLYIYQHQILIKNDKQFELSYIVHRLKCIVIIPLILTRTWFRCKKKSTSHSSYTPLAWHKLSATKWQHSCYTEWWEVSRSVFIALVWLLKDFVFFFAPMLLSAYAWSV